MQDQIAELEDNRNTFEAQLIELSDAAAQVTDRVQEQGERLYSASQQVERYLADHRRSVQADVTEETLLELEVAAIRQRSANRVLVDSLTRLAASEPNLSLAVEGKMAEAGIQPPTEDADLDDEEED